MRIFDSKWDEVRMDWRKLHNEELNDLLAYSSPLGRTKLRWEVYIKMEIQEVGMVEWSGLAWLRIGTGGGLF